MENQNNWELKAAQCWMAGDYNQAADFYEQAISANPNQRQNYWYLGLMLLLAGQEEEAHSTWLLGMMAGDAEQMEEWTAELVQILDAEAKRQAEKTDNSSAWLIRQHLREICPTDINNLLQLIQLAIAEETLTQEDFAGWKVVELLKHSTPGSLDLQLLVKVAEKLLDFAPLESYSQEFIAACLPHLKGNSDFRDILLVAAAKVGYQMRQVNIAISLAQLCLQVKAEHPEEIWRNLALFYEKSKQYALYIEAAKKYYELCEDLADKIAANYQIITALLATGGYWEEAVDVFKRHESMLLSFLQSPPKEIVKIRASRLLTAMFCFPYFRDEPKANRKLQNQIAHLAQQSIQADARKQGYSFNQHLNKPELMTQGRRLKIGYIGNCLRKHSVGWMARGVFQYHDRERFEIHGYFVDYEPGDWLQEWYICHVDQAHTLGSNALQIAEEIVKDEIDILIDVDSLTWEVTFQVMALKPAPIQATWLGLDAAGLPAIDYYLADPLVLPENAQDYYVEKIWRLPKTYIALDGYEVSVPTLRRDQLEIPLEAVVYYSGQTSSKRNPDMAKLQMKIIKEVPNSYFLLKTWPDVEGVKQFFIELAESEGVEISRLRFLPNDPSEIHRANLGIVDVALDTYPYSGATTTLEILWMGIPIVTRVGEQWAARNSYTMMVNAGITEGIAWTDEEYIEWGIRLGLDPELRQKIWWKLRQGRQTAPLWNARQFTQEIEQAYQQMWENYLSINS